MNNSRVNIPKRSIISRNIFLFINFLLQKILFPPKENIDNENKLNLFIEVANEKIISRQITKEKKSIEQRQLTTDYTKENMENIIDFILDQNIIYGPEILENIIIQLCSRAMTINSTETINEYIFDNLKILKDNQLNNFSKLKKWINLAIFKNENMKENFNPPFNNYIIDPFCYLLFSVFHKKFEIINKNKNYNDQYIMKYFHNFSYDGVNNYYLDNIGRRINEKLNEEIDTDNLPYNSSLFNINFFKQIIKYEFDRINEVYEKDKNPTNILINTRKIMINIFKYYFYIFFINSKIQNDLLMEYNISNDNEQNNIINIPFTYNFDYGFICPFYSNMVTTPLKLDKRIKNVSFKQNNIADIGLFGLGEAVALNLNFESINIDKNLVRSYYLEYFIFALRIFNNYNVKEISFNNNIYLKEDIDDFLCEIIKHFKSLKSLNISNNDIKSGITKFCIQLKKLYRSGECELEELNLNKCNLDESSIYELSELIKCNKCKLKVLILSKNDINKKFFKCMKKNNSLTKIMLNKCKIKNEIVKNINLVISLHKSLESIDIGKNDIKSKNEFLKIVARSIKNVTIFEKENIVNDSKIINMDLSQNKIENIDKIFVLNFKELVDKNNLLLLDCSKIFFSQNPNSYLAFSKNSSKQKFVDFFNKNFKDCLISQQDKKKIYLNEIESINNNNNELLNKNKNIAEENSNNNNELLNENNKISEEKINNNNELLNKNKNITEENSSQFKCTTHIKKSVNTNKSKKDYVHVKKNEINNSIIKKLGLDEKIPAGILANENKFLSYTIMTDILI